MRCPRLFFSPFRARRRFRVPLAVQRGPGFPEQPACHFHGCERFELGERGIDYFCRFVLESALSESSSSRVAGGNRTRRLPQFRT